MELRHLRTFSVVSEVQGFTKAAEQLGYAQSSVTAQIQSLEDDIGSPLFDRLGKTVVLTESGRRLLPYAQEMLRLQSAMKDLLQTADQPTGTITIGAPESLAAYRLPEVIKEYRELYPQVKIILKPGVCWELRQQARHGQIDFAFVLEPEAEASDLHHETLIAEELVLVSPLDHPLAAQVRVEAADLQHQILLHTEPGCSYRELFDRYLQDHGVEPSVTMEFWNIEAIKKCVMSGLGIALLPMITVESELEQGKLAALQWDQHSVQVATQLVYHPAKWVSPAIREFLRLVRQHAAVWNQAASTPLAAPRSR